ncbi:hypothetical protein ACFYM2_07880 [Streptomyces sp. NPDC006711]|uniref:hypothetical protein n=1 Tax=Streptomyces sp. NPDC006711 TaxID=3364762 RepID=UPI0036D00152
MAQVSSGELDDRVLGRTWTVRLDAAARGTAAVRVSCSRPACLPERLPTAAAGRTNAVAHLKAHLKAIAGPRPDAFCVCKAEGCQAHNLSRRDERPERGEPWRCGGPVVLAIVTDREGRWWRAMECCSRCAAATPGAKTVATAPPAPRKGNAADGSGVPAAADRTRAGVAALEDTAVLFSDNANSASSTARSGDPAPPPPRSGPLPRARAATSASASPAAAAAPRGTKPWGKIGQRTVPQNLRPDVLRVELIELGDAFRAYQQRAEPDLALLATLHERKARAFALWADVTRTEALREEAERAEKAARTTRAMHANRAHRPTCGDTDATGPQVEWLLTRGQAVHARAVLDHVQDHSPHPEAEVRLAVLMLTLRAARAGTGNVTGQDLTGWLAGDAEPVLERLVTGDWLRLSCTVAQALASRPEDAVAFTVPTLLPDRPRPFAFGKTSRSKISGWAQKAVGDRKLRKKKLGPATRLLALYAAAHSRPDGQLGPEQDGGLHLDRLSAFCALPAEEIGEQAELLVTADWFSEADTSQDRLRARLSERVLPLSGLL